MQVDLFPMAQQASLNARAQMRAGLQQSVHAQHANAHSYDLSRGLAKLTATSPRYGPWC